jgi:hypothetical protein
VGSLIVWCFSVPQKGYSRHTSFSLNEMSWDLFYSSNVSLIKLSNCPSRYPRKRRIICGAIIANANHFFFKCSLSTRWVSYKKQELLPHHAHLDFVLVVSVLVIVFVFCVVLCFVCLRLVSCLHNVQSFWIVHSWLPLRFSPTFI